MHEVTKARFHGCAFATDGGSLGLALKMPDGDIVHFTLDREIGSKTANRIIFMDRSTLYDRDISYTLLWLYAYAGAGHLVYAFFGREQPG